MLRTLHLQDFVIVDQAEIQFESGFTVFSGETGAGKSILIDALALTLGNRADAACVREGAARTDISALFDSPQSLEPWFEAQSIPLEDTLVLRRVIDAQGRSKAYINGVPATLTQLRELGETLVDIHGQHAHQSLLKPASQRQLLDEQGGHQDLARAVQDAWNGWQACRRKLTQAQRDTEAINTERERLEWQVNELNQLSLSDGEWETLSNEHNRLAHAQALLEGAGIVLAALDNEQGSARYFLNQAAHQLQQMTRHDAQLNSIHEALESARIATAEAVSDLNSYVDRLELDPDQLAAAEQRMSAIFDTARKFKVEPEALPELHQTLVTRLAELKAGTDIEALEAACKKAESAYMQQAQKLSTARSSTAKKMAEQVTKAMQTLAMQGGRFDIQLTACSPGAQGMETVEFLVAGHAGTTPRPLAKVASGGELARLSLALSVIASQAARVPTLIFDEVDTGVGGAVAEVVGRLLKELGARHQVLCVTHLPQVAACGNHHYQVSKTVSGKTTLSSIEALDPGARVDEIARMLGGLTITDTTRRHAREMLEG